MTPIKDDDPAAVAEMVLLETDKIRQFLFNQRLLSRDETLEIFILGHGPTLVQIENVFEHKGALNCYCLDLADAAALLELKELPDYAVCDSLWLALLGQRPPAMHYASRSLMLHFRLYLLRHALHCLSALLAAGCFVATAGNLLNISRCQSLAAELERNTRGYTDQYQNITRNFPQIPVSVETMKAAVTLHQKITENGPEPYTLLEFIGRSLDALPRIRVNKLSWKVIAGAAPEDPAAGGVVPATPTGEEAPPASLVGIPEKPDQVLTIEGEVTPFAYDYRVALGEVHRFVSELRKDSRLEVTPTLLPLDTSSSNTLQGAAGSEDRKLAAEFKLVISRKTVH
jgi:hypothetical protein